MSYLELAKRIQAELKIAAPGAENPTDTPPADDLNTAPEPAERLRLVILKRGAVPPAPVKLNPWTEITDVERFVEATLGDLSAYAAGRAGWVGDLVDEKLEALRICGIDVQIREVQ